MLLSRFGKRRSACVSMLTALVFAFGVLCVPGRSSALTISEEKELGQKILEQIRKHMTLVQDGEMIAYVQSVGNRIARQVGTSSYEPKFFIVDEPVPNAFAVPGGYIFIYRGLIEMMGTEDELAGILSHEMAHVQARHIHRQIEESKFIGIASLAGMLAGILLGSMVGGGGGVGNAGAALAVGSAGAGTTAMLRYSREFEAEADQLGLGYLCAAGYDPKAMVTMMQRLDAAKWLQNSKVPNYLLTHPALSERIQNLQEMVEKEKKKKRATPSPATGDFQIMQTALIADHSDSQRVCDLFESGARKGEKTCVYGMGRYYLRQGQCNEAIPKLQEAARLMPASPLVLGTLGSAYYMAGKLAEAQKVLETALNLDPSASMLHFKLATVLLDEGRKSEALEHLQRISEYAPVVPEIDYQLGVVLGQVNQVGLAHYHLGRYHLQKGDWKLALDHFKRAKGLITDSPEKMEEINAEIRQLEKTKKDAIIKSHG